jgi:hypothetical protein
VKKAKFAWMRITTQRFIGGLLFFMVCCQSETIDFTNEDTVNLQNEVASDAYSGDAYDMSHLAVGSTDATFLGRETSGRKFVFKIEDLLKRFDCATVTLETANDNTILRPRGMITLDFGTVGCKDSKGNFRKGKIIIYYSGRRYYPNSTISTTFDGYYVNGVKIEGTRNVTYSSLSTGDKIIFTETLVDGKIVWADGTIAVRAETKSIEWTRTLNSLNDQWKVTGGTNYAAAGVNRKGMVYEMRIVEPLIYTRQCILTSKGTVAVKGVKELLVGNKKITADYGDGDCDREVTITVKGKSKLIQLKSDI